MNVKSIRKDLFNCLNKHGEQTMDDLVTRLGDWNRTQISNNVQAARKEGLATSRKDDVTGAPAYKLTPEGKARLAEIVARDKANAHLSDPAPVSNPVVKESLTTEIIAQPAHDNELADLRAKLDMAEKQRDDHFERAEQAESVLAKMSKDQDDLRNERSLANSTNEKWLSLAGEYECKSIPELRVFIGSLISRVESLKEGQSVAAESAESIDVKEAAIGYLIRVKGKRSLIRSKPDGARDAALSSARVHGRADVLALVPVGKAVRGAEWKEA